MKRANVMKARLVTFASVGVPVACLFAASACSSLQTANSPTTQALGEASLVSGAVASTVAAVAPAPWGQIIAAVLGAVSVIAGVVAHSAMAKNSAEQVVNAVTTGVSAASHTLASATGAAATAN
jgi:hypothetical protein